MRKEESWIKCSRKRDYLTLLFKTLQWCLPTNSLVWNSGVFRITLLLAVSSQSCVLMMFCTLLPLHILCRQPWIPLPNLLLDNPILILQGLDQGSASLMSSGRTDHILFCDPTVYSSIGKESACNAGDPSSIPESGRSAGGGIGYPHQYIWVSLVAQLVKNPPAMWETWVRSLGWEDPLEKAKATHSSILA